MMRLKQIIAESGLTQQQVAEGVGVSPQAINHYINGRREPDISTLIKLADFFNVTVDYLVGRDVREEKPTTDTATMSAGGRTIALDPSSPVQFRIGDRVFELILAEERDR